MATATALLDPDTPETVRLSVAQATALGAGALQRIGYTEDEAATIVAHLVDSALCGYPFAGLPRILAIARDHERRARRMAISIVRETPVAAMVDGGNNVGYLAAYRGACIAIEKSQQCGIAVVGVFNSYYSGRSAYYVEKMVRAGRVAINASSAQPKVLPPGGARPILGTNPLCFGYPSDDGPVIFDMGTASMMGGDLLLHSLLGKEIPEGIGFDESGLPTRDPAQALRGGVLPFGGHKGYGLCFSVQALGLLAGAALGRGRIRDYGFLFLAIDPDILLPDGQFAHQMSELVREIKASPRQPGVDEIRIPFERAARERARRSTEGIVIDRRIVDELNAL